MCSLEIWNEKLTDFIKVKREFSRQRTIESNFQERRPGLFQNVLASNIALKQIAFYEDRLSKALTAAHLTNTGHSGIDGFAAVDVLDSEFSEEEIDIVSDIERSHKLRI